MTHLFLINPIATQVRSRLQEIIREIESFFLEIGQDNYHIHVTRWARDGMGHVNRFALQSPAPVRVHIMGGSGLLYEAINGTIGLPNVQIAAYPMGGANFFIHYFGADKEHLFRSISNQVFSGTTPIDAMRYEDSYGIGYALIGFEAVSDRDGSQMLERTELPADFCHMYSALKAITQIADICQHYNVDIDGRDYSGEYVSMLIAGGPCYGSNMTPALEAHPNDGWIDVYLFKKISAIKLLPIMQTYVAGGYAKLKGAILHERCKRITISAKNDIIMSLDGEKFYERSVSYEIIPSAIEFVCPDAINVQKLPRVYKRRALEGTANVE